MKKLTATQTILFLVALFVSGTTHAYDESTDRLLQGTAMCSSNPSDAGKAFDGDATTSYKARDAKFSWVGLDLGEPHVITRVSFTPAPGSEGADGALLSIFEGANSPDFMDAVPLYLIPEAPATETPTVADINVSKGFRYVRYVGSADSYCSIADLCFYGHAGEGDDSQYYQITNLPTLSIHVKNNVLPTSTNKTDNCESVSKLIYNDGTAVQDYPILMRARGNWSAIGENKGYLIKYNDGKSHHMMRGAANESPSKCKKWVLINNKRDKTLFRNTMAWVVSKRGEKEYTPWNQIVDLVINGDYRGTYTLADKVTVDRNRINITEMTEGDIDDVYVTGGYFIEADHYYYDETYAFLSRHGNEISIHEPDDDIMQPEQFQYIQDTWHHLEDVIYGANFTDRKEGVRSVLDIESFLRYHLLSEFVANTDKCYQVFMYKERGDDLIYTGPLWDHDLALENDRQFYPANTKGWVYGARQAGKYGDLTERVLSDPSVFSDFRSMWAKLRDKGSFDPEALVADVDSLSEEVRASADLNFKRWPYLNQDILDSPEVPGSWDAEVDRVRNFVRDRVAWMDSMLSYRKFLKDDQGNYLIASGADLCALSRKVNEEGETNAKAVLVGDIDMADFNENFQPLGLPDAPFTGKLDGQGHTIYNLRISGDDAVGLVGNAAYCTLCNIVFDETCSAEGANNIGMLLGNAAEGTVTISGVQNHGPVTATGENAGGLVGCGQSSADISINGCSNSGDISAQRGAAAFAGSSAGTVTVKNSYNVGSLTGATEGSEIAFSTQEATVTNCWDYTSTQANNMTPEQVDNGWLCYHINYNTGRNDWRQNLDNTYPHDSWPVLRAIAGTVYETEGAYTNTNEYAPKFRYYKLAITKITDGNEVRFSEFDILDEQYLEVNELSIYDGPENASTQDGWENLIDGKTDTDFSAPFSAGDTINLLFDAGREVEASGYRIYTCGNINVSPWARRNPRSWKLYASNTQLLDADDEGWILIDERVNDESLQEIKRKPYDFFLSKSLEIAVNMPSAVLMPGDEIQLEATYVAPPLMHDILQNAQWQWSSSDESVATVDEEGHVVAVGLGEADIILSSPETGMLRAFSNIHVVEVLPWHRYYQLSIDAIVSGNTIQLSEFDLIDRDGNTITPLSLYSYIGENSKESESAAKLFDGSDRTKYCASFKGNARFFIDAGKEVTLSGYRFTTANDTQGNPGRNPFTWSLYGSNTQSDVYNAEEWELLDCRKNDVTLGAANYTPYDFFFTYTSLPASDDIPVTIAINKQSAQLFLGGETHLEATYAAPVPIPNIRWQWSSTNENVATVDEEGNVVALALGTTSIILSAPDVTTSCDTCVVTVVKAVQGHRYYQLAITAIKGDNTIQLSEFDLLDYSGNEVSPLSLYASVCHSFNNEPPSNLFDNNTKTKYCGNLNNGVTIYMDAGAPIALSGYRFTTANDTQGNPKRNPVTWSLLGSNTQSTVPDDDVWELLDHRENDATLGAANYTPYDFSISFIYPVIDDTPNIAFADATVKSICLAHWDVNGNGELSEAEAAEVKELGEAFKSNADITSFNELQYFTGLTSISDNAFSACRGLTSITIPANVASIGDYAFASCGSLQEIFCKAEGAPDVNADCFSGVNVGDVLLLVPDGAEANYKAHPVWKLFWVETPTSISAMPSYYNLHGAVYDISGRRQNAIRRGLNVIDNRIIFMK